MTCSGWLSGVMAALVMASLGSAQEAGSGPKVSIRLPAGASMEGIQIDRMLTGPFGGYAGILVPAPVMQRYVIDASVEGVAANNVKAVVYMPGCKLRSFEIAMHGESVERPVECSVLPAWPLSGQIVMDSASAAAWEKRSSTLEVEVVYLANWVNRFFGIMDGPVATFHIATVPMNKGGSFTVMLPELALDPAEKSAGDGSFLFTLREKKTWNIVGRLRPSEFADVGMDELALRVQYPALRFTMEH